MRSRRRTIPAWRSPGIGGFFPRGEGSTSGSRRCARPFAGAGIGLGLWAYLMLGSLIRARPQDAVARPDRPTAPETRRRVARCPLEDRHSESLPASRYSSVTSPRASRCRRISPPSPHHRSRCSEAGPDRHHRRDHAPAQLPAAPHRARAQARRHQGDRARRRPPGPGDHRGR
jgi:hypothetical protein